MIKFVGMIGLGLIGGLMRGPLFWMVGGFISLIGLWGIRYGCMFREFIYFRSGVRIDLVSFSLVVLRLFITVLIFLRRNGVYGVGGASYY